MSTEQQQQKEQKWLDVKYLLYQLYKSPILDKKVFWYINVYGGRTSTTCTTNKRIEKLVIVFVFLNGETVVQHKKEDKHQ